MTDNERIRQIALDLHDAANTIDARALELAAIATDPDDPDTPPVDPPPPPPALHELVIPATAFELIGSMGMKLTDDHVSDWGHPGEAVIVAVHATAATTGFVELNYVLAGESAISSARAVSLAPAPVVFPKTCDLWATPTHGKITIPITLPGGATEIAIMIPFDVPDNTAWLDLYAITIRTDKAVGLVTVADPDMPPVVTPPVITIPPSSGSLDYVLDALFPSTGAVTDIGWGQNVANVPAGQTLILPTADHPGREWIIRGLRGRPDAWITIRAETLYGHKVRDLETWRGIGLYDCHYVRVDGIDLYGSGKRNPDNSGDFVSGVEAVGGHHIAVTRTRSTNTGGHGVSFTAGESMEAPANAYILYNVALDTSKRNPYNGSAFNLFHGTTKRTPDGPLAHLGFTDYVIGNQAYGCMSEVGGGPWGITDGNCFILDVGDDSGYDGTLCCAFNIGADNGGRGAHALRTSGLVAVFNTMVGNQRNVTEPASGEFSPHDGTRHQVRANIAAATTRSPAIWYQDWVGGNPHLVNENVILAGTADAPNNVATRPEGLGYLRGSSTKSRNADDYRPMVGTPIIAPDLIATFKGIAAVFPDALGNWRTQAIAGALDAS